MGDEVAAQVLDRFSELVRASVIRWEGRVVKQIGDVFQEPRAALACALEVESRTADEPQFPAARAGIHWGTVLYRSGDYVGSNVNIASRLCTDAGRHQILVTDEVRKEARDLPDIEFVRLGKRKLKGLAENIVLFEARSSEAVAADKFIDPVCGMELSAAEVAASLTSDGVERSFCSDDCLRKFVVAPEKYAG
jgi:class 3 adenylate cyclase/YHS domain-containing protein